MLPKYYDIDYAKKLLLQAEADREKKTKKARQLSLCSINEFEVVQFNQPKSRRLVWSPERTVEIEEHGLRIRGVICGKILPPLGRSSARKRDRHHLSQTIMLTGLGSESFASAMDAVLRIHSKFAREFNDGQLQKFELEKYESYLAIKAHTRYFTQTRMAPEQERIPFDTLVDPEQSLNSLVDDEYTHIADNRVQYGRLVTSSLGHSTVEKASPQIFKCGDIVELTVAFVAYPAKNRTAKMVPVLRGVVMLNQSATEDAIVRETYTYAVNPQEQLAVARIPKRNIFTDDDDIDSAEDLEDGELEDEPEHTRGKMARMHLDDDVPTAIRRGLQTE